MAGSGFPLNVSKLRLFKLLQVDNRWHSSSNQDFHPIPPPWKTVEKPTIKLVASQSNPEVQDSTEEVEYGGESPGQVEDSGEFSGQVEDSGESYGQVQDSGESFQAQDSGEASSQASGNSEAWRGNLRPSSNSSNEQNETVERSNADQKYDLNVAKFSVNSTRQNKYKANHYSWEDFFTALNKTVQVKKEEVYQNNDWKGRWKTRKNGSQYFQLDEDIESLEMDVSEELTSTLSTDDVTLAENEEKSMMILDSNNPMNMDANLHSPIGQHKPHAYSPQKFFIQPGHHSADRKENNNDKNGYKTENGKEWAGEWKKLGPRHGTKMQADAEYEEELQGATLNALEDSMEVVAITEEAVTDSHLMEGLTVVNRESAVTEAILASNEMTPSQPVGDSDIPSEDLQIQGSWLRYTPSSKEMSAFWKSKSPISTEKTFPSNKWMSTQSTWKSNNPLSTKSSSTGQVPVPLIKQSLVSTWSSKIPTSTQSLSSIWKSTEPTTTKSSTWENIASTSLQGLNTWKDIVPTNAKSLFSTWNIADPTVIQFSSGTWNNGMPTSTLDLSSKWRTSEPTRSTKSTTWKNSASSSQHSSAWKESASTTTKSSGITSTWEKIVSTSAQAPTKLYPRKTHTSSSWENQSSQISSTRKISVSTSTQSTWEKSKSTTTTKGISWTSSQAAWTSVQAVGTSVQAVWIYSRTIEICMSNFLTPED
jgi:hypothetical protein